MPDGRIVKALSGYYYVDTGDAVWQCRARGIFKKDGVTPLVGDEVRMSVTDEKDGEGVVEEILPRVNAFIRPPVANVEMFLVTVAATEPEPNPELTDRFLVSAEAADAEAVVVINKDDLSPVQAKRIAAIYKDVYPVAIVSAENGEGMDALWALVRGKRVAFAGASGVGKTSLLACLLDDVQAGLETGAVSRKTGRGKHTTRHVEIFRCADGTMLYDTPGFSSFEPSEAADLAGECLGRLFPEFAEPSESCRFDDCTHTHEPDCAVRAALEAGRIRPSRYASYEKILREVEKWQNFHHRS
ncbi:MAG: ribosome small subunit-dependent GTPase A [Clostridiales Family XIII bacterium]|jgi:ribosome biogenesis GTPase|nr:ribosome small subunit-dependent GTPase A [Clostridiales Family XIII bacterium]